MKMRWYSYDVWGNAKDGYEINNVFRTNEVIDIPNVVLVSDRALITYLKKIGFMKSSVRANLVEFDDSGSSTKDDWFTLSISYKGRPDGEFRKEK